MVEPWRTRWSTSSSSALCRREVRAVRLRCAEAVAPAAPFHGSSASKAAAAAPQARMGPRIRLSMALMPAVEASSSADRADKLSADTPPPGGSASPARLPLLLLAAEVTSGEAAAAASPEDEGVSFSPAPGVALAAASSADPAAAASAIKATAGVAGPVAAPAVIFFARRFARRVASSCRKASRRCVCDTFGDTPQQWKCQKERTFPRRGQGHRRRWERLLKWCLSHTEKEQ